MQASITGSPHSTITITTTTTLPSQPCNAAPSPSPSPPPSLPSRAMQHARAARYITITITMTMTLMPIPLGRVTQDTLYVKAKMRTPAPFNCACVFTMKWHLEKLCSCGDKATAQLVKPESQLGHGETPPKVLLFLIFIFKFRKLINCT